MKMLAAVLLFVSGLAVADWQAWDLKSMVADVCKTTVSPERSCRWYNSIDTDEVGYASGVAFVKVDNDGYIEEINLSAEMEIDGRVIDFKHVIVSKEWIDGQKIIVGDDGHKIHFSQIHADKLKFMIETPAGDIERYIFQ